MSSGGGTSSSLGNCAGERRLYVFFICKESAFTFSFFLFDFTLERLVSVKNIGPTFLRTGSLKIKNKKYEGMSSPVFEMHNDRFLRRAANIF